MSTTEKPQVLFSPGRIVYPPPVQRALRQAGLHGVALLARHFKTLRVKAEGERMKMFFLPFSLHPSKAWRVK